MKALSIAIVTLSLLGCGGGGGGGGGGGATALTPEQSADLALAILQDCQTGEIEAFLDDIEPIRDLLSDQTAQPPNFEITGINILGASFDWRVDVDNDGTFDLTGTLAFRDQNGNPTLPISLASLIIGDPLDLQSVLGSLVDGTRLVFSFSATDPAVVDGTITAVVQNGTVFTAEGQGTVTSGTCTSSFEFSPIDFTNLEGDWPVADMDMTVQGSQGSLQGVVSLVGTKDAAATLTVNGGQGTHSYAIDMETGAVVFLGTGS